MHLLNQSAAVTVLVGPVLAADGTAYTGMAIGDFNVTKNGTTAALASAATATHSHEGYYLIALTTGNTDTIGRLAISCNKATYAMPVARFQVLHSNVFGVLTGSVAPSTLGGVAQTGDAYSVVNSGTYGNSLILTAVNTRSSHSAADVWTVGTRTLSGFGSLVADIVAAVWLNATRSLTSFGFATGLATEANATTNKNAVLTAIDDIDTSGGATTIIVAPLSAEQPSPTIRETATTVGYRYCKLPAGPLVITSGGSPVDVSGGVIVMHCVNVNDPSITFSISSESGAITVGGDDDNYIYVDYTPLIAGEFKRTTYFKPTGETGWQKIEIGGWQIEDGINPETLLA